MIFVSKGASESFCDESALKPGKETLTWPK